MADLPSAQRRRVMIFAADRVPGLYDLEIEHDPSYRDLTTAQVTAILRREGFDPAQIVAVPRA